MKVVIDTNILISYGLGNPDVVKIMDYLAKTGSQIFADSRLLHEYQTITRKSKFGFSNEIIAKINNWIEKYISVVDIPQKTIKFNPDRQDSKIIEIANQAKCDYIITDDKPILKNSSHLCIAKPVSSKQFIEIINNLNSV